MGAFFVPLAILQSNQKEGDILENKVAKSTKLLIVMTSLSAMCIIASNLLAIKLTTAFGIAVDCGILLFPISYVIGDLSVEFFGKKTANFIVAFSATVEVILTLCLLIAVSLPAHADWGDQAAFASVFGFMPRVVIGSLLAYIASGLLNNFVFERMRQRYDDSKTTQIFIAPFEHELEDELARIDRRNFAWRAIASSILAHLVDSAIFETIAFYGVLPTDEFLRQAIFAFAAGLLLELIMFVLATRFIRQAVKKWLEK